MGRLLRAGVIMHAREYSISTLMQLAPLLDFLLFVKSRAPIGSVIAKSSNALEPLPPIPEEQSTKQKSELLGGSYLQDRMRGVGIFLYIHHSSTWNGNPPRWIPWRL